ncbi:intradiol ring-cleavage dioxygenase [Demequina pelophila]|uniref:intradiol ring-cleavage dioxygenase n=1 Tax=Demequina pelophila TaxID=1638984 RepID=UPI000785D56A|nr:intradiol ring-cleavage dioxygenase [Demequina pelophila]
MTGFPEPDQTPDGPAYEGRLLDRPDEEVVDQGVSFDITTLLSRRHVVGIMGAGVGVAALAACTPSSSSSTGGTADGSTSGGSTDAGTGSSSGSSSGSTSGSTSSAGTDTLPAEEIPDETAGPYPGDGSNGPDVLEESGVVREDIRTSIEGGDAVDGVPLDFTFTILDMANGDVPMVGAAVYAWHCDAQGRYSMYSDGVEDQTWLRGVQVTDDDGRVTFASILPGCYTGRWTHIHFEVYPDASAITDSANAIATSQMAFPQDVLDTAYTLAAYDGSAANLSQITLQSDNVFGDDGGELQMATMGGDADSGYTATLAVRVDTGTEPTAGTMAGGAGAPGDMGGDPGEMTGGGPGGERPSGGPGGEGGPGGTPPDGGPGDGSDAATTAPELESASA